MYCISSFLEKLGYNKQNQVSLIKHYEILPSGERISLTQKLRRIWLAEENKYILGNNEPVFIICGEFSSTDTARRALENGYSIKVICGSHMFNKKSKEEVAELKEKYGDKFELYIYSKGDKQKPPYHSVLIGRNLFFENKHDMDPKNPERTSYDIAEIIENADKKRIAKYKKLFDGYRVESTMVKNAAQIRGMQVL